MLNRVARMHLEVNCCNTNSPKTALELLRRLGALAPRLRTSRSVQIFAKLLLEFRDDFQRDALGKLSRLPAADQPILQLFG